MKTHNHKHFLALATLLLLSVAIAPTAWAQFSYQDPLGLGTTSPAVFITTVMQNIIIFFLGLVGLIALVVITYGGIRLMIGGSLSDAEVAQAKRIIFWGVIGLMVVGLSLTIIIEVGNLIGLPLF